LPEGIALGAIHETAIHRTESRLSRSLGNVPKSAQLGKNLLKQLALGAQRAGGAATFAIANCKEWRLVACKLPDCDPLTGCRALITRSRPTNGKSFSPRCLRRGSVEGRRLVGIAFAILVRPDRREGSGEASRTGQIAGPFAIAVATREI
jgi:hypothetical protein